MRRWRAEVEGNPINTTFTVNYARKFTHITIGIFIVEYVTCERETLNKWFNVDAIAELNLQFSHCYDDSMTQSSKSTLPISFHLF